MDLVKEDAQQAWSHLFEATNDAVLLINSEQQLIHANSVARRMFGAGLELDRSAWEQPNWDRVMKSPFEGGREIVHGKCLCQDGQQRSFPISIQLLHREGEGLIYQVVCRMSQCQGWDSSAVSHLGFDQPLLAQQMEGADTQVQLIHTEKMASVGQLAAGISHEINNPLAFVTSNLEVLERYIDNVLELIGKYRAVVNKAADGGEGLAQSIVAVGTTEDKYDLSYLLEDLPSLVTETLEGARRATDIIRSLRIFVRGDAGGPIDVDLREQLDATLKILTPQTKHHCEVLTEYGELPMIRCYSGQIGQVFLNLLLNAIQAVPDGGRVKVSTRASDELVEVVIEDNGPGIQKNKLDRIFEPFFTTKGVGEGTGLGLPISKRIVESHGGTLLVESTPGEGCTFTVSLPREPRLK